MKANSLNLMIALLLSAVLAYGFWSIAGELRHYVAVGSFVFCVGTLIPLLGGNKRHGRRGVNLSVICGLFLVFGLILNVIFALANFSASSYIVISALIFLTYIFLANTIQNVEQ